jgi:cytochrome c-type biogenesis protein CcmH/NrfG
MARTDLIARALLAAVALAAIAWLALSYRNVVLLDEAFDIAATPDVPPERIEHALDLADRGEALNPDRAHVWRLQAVLQRRLGRLDLAIDTMQAATRAEPENSDAWAALTDLTRDADPELSAEARARWAKLDPAAARRLRER